MLPFLLEYPLGKKRLEKTVNFFISNLSYEFPSGRESVLLVLEGMLSKV